ncbi:MAG TPA: hypothetical protein VN634_02570 [Candidatus Limnocylindrales bacterium]|nr:hypothetical protein [Candidatus Limnocylindrales bacterium]
MLSKRSIIGTLAGSVAILSVALSAGNAQALSSDRWTNGTPYGVFFNDYQPNFYTGFVPREQQAGRIKIHLGRGNQLRLRLVLSDATIDNYIPDQVARHDLYKEVIDAKVITLTTNTSWETYDKRFAEAGFTEHARKKATLPAQEWRELNLRTLAQMSPDRLFHIQKDFTRMLDDFAALLKASEPPASIDAKLDLANAIFPHRVFVDRLTPAQDAALGELVGLAKADDKAGFRPKAQAFFDDITGGIYAVHDGKLDYYEYTVIYPAGTYDKTTTYKGHIIPEITTGGIWPLIPRMHGKGFLGMIDYISSEPYYGLMPMLPYQYVGGIEYNAIHNTGISNWIGGHALLPKEWRTVTEGSRSGKPFTRVSMTSRGPVSHGCTRIGNGHLTELRELLPSTSDGMKGIVTYRNVSHCYDVFDPKGDGNDQIMGVQYYIAFRHTGARVANQIWAQNNREDFYRWLYSDEMSFGPIGSVTFPEVCDGKFVDRKPREGKTYKGLKLYEAPYVPESDAIQFYTIKGVDELSLAGMDFNRELRRVGHGYTIDRAKLLLH